MPETTTVMTGDASSSNLSITGKVVPRGSCATIALTLFWTSCAATSGDFSSANRTMTRETPSPVIDRSSSIPSIVLTASSIGRVTCVSISSTLAPRRVVVTNTNGRSSLGWRSTPSR